MTKLLPRLFVGSPLLFGFVIAAAALAMHVQTLNFADENRGELVVQSWNETDVDRILDEEAWNGANTTVQILDRATCIALFLISLLGLSAVCIPDRISENFKRPSAKRYLHPAFWFSILLGLGFGAALGATVYTFENGTSGPNTIVFNETILATPPDEVVDLSGFTYDLETFICRVSELPAPYNTTWTGACETAMAGNGMMIAISLLSLLSWIGLFWFWMFDTKPTPSKETVEDSS